MLQARAQRGQVTVADLRSPGDPAVTCLLNSGVLWEFSWVQTKLWMIGDTWPASYHGNGQALTCPQLLLAMHPSGEEWVG